MLIIREKKAKFKIYETVKVNLISIDLMVSALIKAHVKL